MFGKEVKGACIMKKMIRKQRENGCRGYLGPGDMISPFDLG